ncbi:peptidoglycan-binding domain-containing protein [Streptomyces sp. 891-h]|uniref:peptidoglycan-binding domain-containing protein n=1 Tax=Streptomyces sp. 891-h TaxID=2720714 RepID=UPI001FA998FE|nr:peptidoglycan-binding domain-containing protein [Streptomyces sp. 891-h]UNZ19500.1 peptidoglycan-binding protein [Streptomyces sp. 891-h]
MTGDGRCPECGGNEQLCAHAEPAATDGRPDDRSDDRGGAPYEPEDPLHIRPYVQLRENGPTHPAEQVPDGAADGTGNEAAPDDAHVPLPDLSPFAVHGTDETAELPAVTGSGGGSGDERARTRRGGAGAAKGAAPADHRRPRERRRPSTAVFAGVGVAAVLGGGLLTTQLLTDNGSRSGDGRALRHMPTGAPTHTPPTPSPSTEEKPERGERPRPTPSRAGASATPRADRDSGEHTASPSPSRGGKKHASGKPGSSGKGERGHDGRRPRWPGHSSDETLRPGDSGTEVVELQRRLKQVGYYDRNAPEDGEYSSQVQEAVFRYQARHHLWDDTPGEYGPATRRHLEARTTG